MMISGVYDIRLRSRWISLVLHVRTHSTSNHQRNTLARISSPSASPRHFYYGKECNDKLWSIFIASFSIKFWKLALTGAIFVPSLFFFSGSQVRRIDKLFTVKLHNNLMINDPTDEFHWFTENRNNRVSSRKEENERNEKEKRIDRMKAMPDLKRA